MYYRYWLLLCGFPHTSDGWLPSRQQLLSLEVEVRQSYEHEDLSGVRDDGPLSGIQGAGVERKIGEERCEQHSQE